MMQSPASSRSLIPPARTARIVLAYLAMIALAAGLYSIVRARGETLPPPLASGPIAAAHASHSPVLAQVLLALAVITLAARVAGTLFERFLKQPPVMGEIVAGLVLGPSVLGAISTDAYRFVLPTAAAPHLGIIAKLGVVLFMFIVGLDLNPKLMRGNTHATIAISHASIVTPFVLGSALALGLYSHYGNRGVSFTVFSLFLGVSMSVTAFPVLARILTDRKIETTPLGVTALSCAAVDDATAWCLLALVSGVATAQIGHAWRTIGLVALYVSVMFAVVRPLTQRLAIRMNAGSGPISLTQLATVLAIVLLSATATEYIGIHALFGAFLLGAILPHEGRLAEQLKARLEDVVLVLLLPVFFAFTGMRTQIALVSSASDWMACGAIIVVATLGKFGGSFAAARVAGLGWRESSALGILMNTRGLMELIVLNAGLDMGVLSPKLFTMMVLMALVTTFATTPILDLIRARGTGATAADRLLQLDTNASG